MRPDPTRPRRWRWVVRWVQPDGEHGQLQFAVRDVLRARRMLTASRAQGDHATIRLERVAPWRLGDL